jgi:hypothetical protein
MVKFEQLLERDFLLLSDFSSRVLDIHEQPFRLDYAFGNTTRRYTPDFQLSLADGTQLVVEVKPTRSLAKPEIQAKFDAIRAAMARQLISFVVLTEEVIRREPRLSNLKVLHPYLRQACGLPHATILRRLRRELEQAGSLSLAQCAQIAGDRESVLVLIAHGHLSCDFDRPVDDLALITIADKEHGNGRDNWF